MPSIFNFKKENSVYKEIGDGIALDYTEDGKVMGIEILKASQKMLLKNNEEITLSVPIQEVV